MSKSVKITVHLSTNPQVAGRYFLDMRDTSNGRNRQMATRTVDHDEVVKFIAEVCKYASPNNVSVEIRDETREMPWIEMG